MGQPLGSPKSVVSNDKEETMSNWVVDKNGKVYAFGFADSGAAGTPEYWLEAWPMGKGMDPGPYDVVGGPDGIYGSHTNLMEQMMELGIWSEIEPAYQALILMDLPIPNASDYETDVSNKEGA